MWTDRQTNVQKVGGTIRKRDVTYLMSPVAILHTRHTTVIIVIIIIIIIIIIKDRNRAEKLKITISENKCRNSSKNLIFLGIVDNKK